MGTPFPHALDVVIEKFARINCVSKEQNVLLNCGDVGMSFFIFECSGN